MKNENRLRQIYDDHVPKNGFKNRTQYRRVRDAIGVAVLLSPDLVDPKLFRELQEWLQRSADMLLEDLTARKLQVPIAEPEETVPDQEATGPVIDAEPTSAGHVVPYRKTG